MIDVYLDESAISLPNPDLPSEVKRLNPAENNDIDTQGDKDSKRFDSGILLI